MKIKMICMAAALSAVALTQASAGGLLSGNRSGGIGNGAIVVAPSIGLLNGNNTSLLSGLLNGNSILNRSSILSDNDGNGLLGLGILSGNNSGNTYRKNVRR